MKPEANFPRRNRLDHQTPAEAAIRTAIAAVEALDADERLTKAVILLEQARIRVADYVDEALAAEAWGREVLARATAAVESRKAARLLAAESDGT